MVPCRCEDVDPVEPEEPVEVPVELIGDQKQAPVELINKSLISSTGADLKAAVEVNSSKGFKRSKIPISRQKHEI